MSNIMEDTNETTEKSLLEQVISDLGGVTFATETCDKTLEVATKLFPKHSLYQNTIKICRGLGQIIIPGHKIYNSIKSYKENQKLKYARQRKSHKILHLLGKEELDDYELDCYDFDVGSEVIRWFLSRPKTKNFRIVDFYDTNFASTTTKNLDRGEYYIMIEFDNYRYMLELDLMLINGHLGVSSSNIHIYNGKYQKINELKQNVFGEFIKHFDTSKNVIIHDGTGLSSRPRKIIEYDIDQIDIHSLQSEIIKSIDKGRQRGYIMVGPPGVGKSTGIIKLEQLIPNTPIIYVSTKNIRFNDDIITVFRFLRSISPCIVIFEDLDSFELSNKHDMLFGNFLDQMDSLKHDECLIVIATVNEPEKIHYSLINRRGRFDKVFFVNYPKTYDAIIKVFQNKYKHETQCLFPCDCLENNYLKRIIENELSHADICEILDHLIINDIDVTKDSLKESLNVLLKTKSAIFQCGENDETENG